MITKFFHFNNWAYECSTCNQVPVLENLEKCSHPESHSNISNLLLTELVFYTLLVHCINRDSLHTRIFLYNTPSVFRFQLSKNGFTSGKRLRGFWEKAQFTVRWRLNRIGMGSEQDDSDRQLTSVRIKLMGMQRFRMAIVVWTQSCLINLCSKNSWMAPMFLTSLGKIEAKKN